MSIDDVEHNYIVPHSIETLNAFQDKASFSSTVLTSQLHEGLQNKDLSFLSTNNFSTICSEESSIGFTMNNKIGLTPSEATLMSLHDKRAFVTYSDEDENRTVIKGLKSKLGARADEESDSHIVSSDNQKDPYLLTRPYQGFNTLDVGEDEKNGSIEAASLAPAIAYVTQMRLGNIFCLWCGAGPMPSMCRGKKCIALHKAEIHLTLPRAVRNLFKRHVGLCKKHNHIFPRGECKGRCPDCGGCNQGDACEHYNASGGAKHPSPDGTEEWPLCSKIDGSRCFKENFYQIVDPHFNRPPSRIQTAPSSNRPRKKKSRSSIGSISGNYTDGSKPVSRPSTSSSNSRPNSSSGDNSSSNSRPSSKKAKSRPQSRASNNKNDNGIDTDKFRTKFTPVKKFPKNKFSNTAPNKRPSSRSSLKRMLNKNSRTLSNIHKKGHRYKYLARPKSSPIASLATRQAGKKGTNIRSSNSSLILMQNNLFGGSYTSSNSSYGNSYVDSKHRVVRGSENIEIRPPLVKKLKKTTKKSTKKYMA